MVMRHTVFCFTTRPYFLVRRKFSASETAILSTLQQGVHRPGGVERALKKRYASDGGSGGGGCILSYETAGNLFSSQFPNVYRKYRNCGRSNWSVWSPLPELTTRFRFKLKWHSSGDKRRVGFSGLKLTKLHFPQGACNEPKNDQ